MADQNTNKPVAPPTTTGVTLPTGFTLDDIKKLLASGNKQDVLDALAIRKQLKELETEEIEAREKDRVELNKLKTIEKMIEEQARKQEECTHVKENGRDSAVIGIRDSSNTTHYICQHCQKEWVDQNLPLYLRVHPNNIGGPAFQ